MSSSMSRTPPTAQITIGPFFPPRYVDPGANDLTLLEGRPARGETIEIYGRVTQGDGTPLHNLIAEIWQADATGIFRHAHDPRAADGDPNFFGWGRAATDEDGRYRFRTIRPGRYPMPDGSLRAAHIEVVMLFSGIMRPLHTVLFFEGEPGHETDAVLAAVPPDRRGTLIASKEANEPARYRFDIRLHGDAETVFFDA
jgi:protocatechuate 3,4-dioxygenase alpha subunit